MNKQQLLWMQNALWFCFLLLRWAHTAILTQEYWISKFSKILFLEGGTELDLHRTDKNSDRFWDKENVSPMSNRYCIVFQIQRLYFTDNVCHPHMHHRNHHHTYDHCIMVSSTIMYYHTSTRTSEKEKAKGKQATNR